MKLDRLQYIKKLTTDKYMVTKLGRMHLQDIFESKKLLNFLFPQNLLVTFNVPLRIMKENIDHILAEKAVVFGSNISVKGNPSKAMFSIGHPYRCERGQLYTLHIYGTNTNYLHGHIINHMRNVSDCSEDGQLTVIFEIYAEPVIRTEVESTMLNFGFEHHSWDGPSEIFCTEEEFRLYKMYRSKL